MSHRPALQMFAIATALVVGAAALPPHARAQSDLDRFMQRVLARRDDNWKKLQQYVLNEREAVDLRGPSNTRIWGDEREYTWFIRDGFFVRSPVKAGGVSISEAERRQYEAEFLDREKRREARFAGRGEGPAAAPESDTPASLDNLLRQSREPRFVSSAYFLRFRFDEGKYALAGRETVSGREALKIEYYPSNLFPQGRRGPGRLGSNPVDTETRRLLNKVAIITLWVDQSTDQIVKYTFDNVDLEFLPAQWLVRVDDLRASMTMDQPFPDVWLPQGIDINVGLALAIGDFKVHYGVAYSDYRQANVTSTLHVPPDR